VDALANPSLQRLLLIVLTVVAAAATVTLVAALWSVRRPMPMPARVFRRRLAAVSLFVVVAAAAAFAVLVTPVDDATHARPPRVAGARTDEGEVVPAGSSARIPGLTLDAPEGWKLEADGGGQKVTATSDKARLLVSTAILKEAVDVEALLRHLADTQRELGFEAGAIFSDRIGDLPAAGFLATGPARSVCTWMVRRDVHLVSSAICTAEGGTVTAREACRAPLARLRWRAPGP